MLDDISATLRWWVEHANKLEAERNFWRNLSRDLYNTVRCTEFDCEDCRDALDMYCQVTEGG